MSGHHPFRDLIKDWPEERLRKMKLGSERLDVKIKLSDAIGEKLLRENDELSDLLCEVELDFSDKELVEAIEEQIAAVAGTAQDFTSARRKRIDELTDEVRGWIALAESRQDNSAEQTQDSSKAYEEVQA